MVELSIEGAPSHAPPPFVWCPAHERVAPRIDPDTNRVTCPRCGLHLGEWLPVTGLMFLRSSTGRRRRKDA